MIENKLVQAYNNLCCPKLWCSTGNVEGILVNTSNPFRTTSITGLFNIFLNQYGPWYPTAGIDAVFSAILRLLHTDMQLMEEKLINLLLPNDS